MRRNGTSPLILLCRMFITYRITSAAALSSQIAKDSGGNDGIATRRRHRNHMRAYGHSLASPR